MACASRRPGRRCQCREANGCLKRTVSWKGQAEGRTSAFGGNDRGQVALPRGLQQGPPRPLAGQALQKHHSISWQSLACRSGRRQALPAQASVAPFRHQPEETTPPSPPQDNVGTGSAVTSQPGHCAHWKHHTDAAQLCAASPASRCPCPPRQDEAHACLRDCLSRCLSTD